MAISILKSRENHCQFLVFGTEDSLHYDVCYVYNFRENRPITKLTRYHFKTLMLWACEQKPVEFFCDSNLAVHQLLNKMIVYLKRRSCFNYFIRHSNFNHLSNEELQEESQAMEHQLLTLLNTVVLIWNDCKKIQLEEESIKCCISLPSWIARFVIILNEAETKREDYKWGQKDALSHQVSEALGDELLSLFCACGLKKGVLRLQILKSKIIWLKRHLISKLLFRI